MFPETKVEGSIGIRGKQRMEQSLSDLLYSSTTTSTLAGNNISGDQH